VFGLARRRTPPNVVHRALATMTILNIVFPKFDPTDEVLIDD
jgi:hypothetical protein